MGVEKLWVRPGPGTKDPDVEGVIDEYWVDWALVPALCNWIFVQHWAFSQLEISQLAFCIGTLS